MTTPTVMRSAAAALVLACVLMSGCTYQQMAAFNSAVNGFSAVVAASQRERALRAYEQSVYAPAPQTVVVIHRDER